MICLNIYIYIFVYLFTYTRQQLYAMISLDTYIHIYTHTYTCKQMCVMICLNLYIYTHKQMYAMIGINMCIYIYSQNRAPKVSYFSIIFILFAGAMCFFVSLEERLRATSLEERACCTSEVQISWMPSLGKKAWLFGAEIFTIPESQRPE